MTARFADVEKLHADDIAEAVTYVVTGPVAEIVTRPTDQVRERWIVPGWTQLGLTLSQGKGQQ